MVSLQSAGFLFLVTQSTLACVGPNHNHNNTHMISDINPYSTLLWGCYSTPPIAFLALERRYQANDAGARDIPHDAMEGVEMEQVDQMFSVNNTLKLNICQLDTTPPTQNNKRISYAWLHMFRWG